MKEQMLTKQKRIRGITLIALVITIIVLLILAGVSIATLAGEDGILSQANNAKEQHIHANTHESLALEITNYNMEKKLGITSKDMIEYLKSKNIIDDDFIINVKKLVGQTLSLGKGNITDGDYYIIEEVEENGTIEYKLVYYGKTKTADWEKDLIGIKDGNSGLGVLADIVEVGDYVNYAPTYENALTVKEGIGNAWRVAYVDEDSGVVTLVTEGLPLITKLTNQYDSNCQLIDFDYDSIEELFDDTVADNIDILTIEDVKLLSTQAGYTLAHTEADESNYIDEEYRIDNDNLNIISIGQMYLLNTISADQYGKQHYLWWYQNQWTESNSYFTNTDNSSNVGIRLTVDLKADLEYYGGSGTSGDPYKIY